MNHQEIREALLAHVATDDSEHQKLWSAVNQHIDEADDAGEETPEQHIRLVALLEEHIAVVAASHVRLLQALDDHIVGMN